MNVCSHDWKPMGPFGIISNIQSFRICQACGKTEELMGLMGWQELPFSEWKQNLDRESKRAEESRRWLEERENKKVKERTSALEWLRGYQTV